MVNRPDKVRIGAMDVQVIPEGNGWFRSSNCVAQWDPIKQTIRIYDEGSPESLACRFVHEVTHGLIWYMDHANNEALSEEQACNIAGYALSDFWRSNPEAFDWYVECMKGNSSSNG